MKLTGIEGSSSLVKDVNGVVHNINTSEVERARARKAERLNKEKELDDMKSDMSDIKGELNDIKTLLNKFLESQ